MGENMTEKEMILDIIERLDKNILYKDNDAVEFRSFDGSILIEFDNNGFVTSID